MAGATDAPSDDPLAVAPDTSAGHISEAPVVSTARVALPSVNLESPTAKQQPQGSARRLATLQEGLDQAIADRDRAALDLAEANKNLGALETSQRALEDATSRLREAAEATLQTTSKNLQRIIADRDRALADRRSTQIQVDNARASIARLEHGLKPSQADRSRIKALNHENELLLADLANAQSVSSALKKASDRAVQDRDQLRHRVAGLISFIQPAQDETPLSSSSKSTPAASKKTAKRPRGSSSAGSSSPPRSRPRQRSPKPVSESSTVLPSHGGSASRSLFLSGPSTPNSGRLSDGDRSPSQRSPSVNASPTSSDDDSLLAALASSRSSGRRRSSSTGSLSGRSSSRSIDIE
ncbi:uncharacterized protein KRP23_5306 [Phytophthora ramorum]|uniref:uncharacterized protein n=1 Tax=Phytophthora ramorum TaxID=164328 RepID=UPI00309EB070|nr:hypothetical protein KRP23_5306 [Phytophthora ramorum]